MSARSNQRQGRLQELLAFDQAMRIHAEGRFGQAFTGVIGVDEVGRGSLIGPVVACAAMFMRDVHAETELMDLDDSKAAHLNHEKRLTLSAILKSHCIWGIGEASRDEVETLNISKASLLAAHRAIMALAHEDSHQPVILMDGKFTIPGLALPQLAQVKGDSMSAAIAAASVIAKAHRDAMVIALAQDYPGYGWETNMGYPTPAHKTALARLGVTPLHRRTYQAVREVMEAQQLALLPG